MSTHGGDIYFGVKLDEKQYNQGLNQLDRKANKVGAGIGTKLGAGIGAKLGIGIGTALKVAVAGAVATMGVGMIAKRFIDEGAKIEQAFGGIETMFKSSSDQMKRYAMEAYRTAGISATSYMEQATSFSASLLQSLNGNVAKSAEIANQAIIDMSDNSNKFGTSIENLQNAYQGFAKQNFTMLDNLKLGYGGTRTEMQRLLNDAQALSGRAFNINSLADIYQAIHIIQKELGVTGTTAKEAMTTWAGAVNMLKASMSNFASTVGQGLINLLQPVLRVLAQMADALTALGVRFLAWTEKITGKANGIRSAFNNAFGKSSQKQLGNTGNALGGVGNATKGVGGNAKKAKKEVQALKRELMGFDRITKLTKQDTNTGTSAGGGVGSIGGGSVDYSDAMTDTSAFADFIDQTLGSIKIPDKLQKALGELGKAFGDLWDTIKSAGLWCWENVLKPLGEWTINEYAPATVEALAEAVKLVNNVLKVLGSILEPLWEPIIKPFINFIGDVAILNINLFTDKIKLLNSALELIKPVIDSVWQGIKTLKEWLDQAKESGTLKISLVDSFSEAWKKVKDAWGDASSKTATATLKLSDSFSSAWKKVKDAWNGVKSKTVTVTLSFKNAITKTWNSIADKVNNARNKSKIVKALFPQKLPKLAQGGYVKANAPQLAMIGDNKHEGEIVAPESKLKAMAEEVANNSANAQVVTLLNAILVAIQSQDNAVYLDGRAITRSVVSNINNDTKRTGMSPIII